MAVYRKKRDEINEADFRRAVAQVGHMPDSVVRLIKLVRLPSGAPLAKNDIRELAKQWGIDLVALRKNTKTAAEAKHALAAADGADATSPLEGISILDLFDRLLPYFKQQDTSDDGDSLDEEDEGDPRATWIAWRVFLAAAFGEPCPDEIPECPYPGVPEDLDVPRGAASLKKGMSNREIYEACTGRANWPEVQAKIVSLVVGRRGGKSYITAIIGIFLACCRRYRLNLGTKGMVMILARDREQAGVIRRYVLAFLQAVPELGAMLKGQPTQKLIELTNGITIEVRAVSDGGTRGYTVVGALMDEIAFWPTDSNSARQDRKIIRALRPAMFGIKGAMLVMLSSPYAKRGEFYDTYRKGYANDEQRRTFVWQADTLSMRPEQDPELLTEIREEYTDDPESAKAEYGAHFRSDLESIFSKAAIEALCEPGRYEQGYFAARAPYRAFVDPSGGSSDSYTLAIAHDETREVVIGDTKETITVPVLDKIVEWQPRFDPEAVSIEVVTICKTYRISSVTGDAFGGEWPRDPLKKRGIGYTLSDRSRSELYLDLLPMVNSARCELLDGTKHIRMVNQFANLERRPGRGKDVVDHPTGSHDDVANAVAGVLVNVGTGSLYRIRRPNLGGAERNARHGETVTEIR
jgi:hypothetical protein